MRSFKLEAFATFGILAAASPASAANYNLVLTGNPALLTPGTFPGGTKASLVLAGLDGSSPLSVSQGDSLHVTVNLSSLITIPIVTGTTLVDDLFLGTGFDGSTVITSDAFNFYKGGNLVATFNGADGAINQIASGISYAAGSSLSFDSYTDAFTIDTLASPAMLTGATFTYDRFDAVPAPEPATWMLTIAGMGAIGGVMRRRAAKVRLA